MVQSISPPFTPHYPWLQGEPLFANELNAAIANAGRGMRVTDWLPAGQPDGTTDNTSFIQAAINAAAGHGALEFPANPNAYIISSPLLIPSTTHLIIDAGATLQMANGANCSMTGILANATNVMIDLYGTLDGNRTHQTAIPSGGICSNGNVPSTNVFVDGHGQGTIQNFYNWPVNITACTNGEVRGVTILNCGSSAEFSGICPLVNVASGSYTTATGAITFSTSPVAHGISVGQTFVYVLGAGTAAPLRGEYVAVTVPDAFTVTCAANPNLVGGNPALTTGKIGTCTPSYDVGFVDCAVNGIQDIAVALYGGVYRGYIRGCNITAGVSGGAFIFSDNGQPGSNHECEIVGNVIWNNTGSGGVYVGSNATNIFQRDSVVSGNHVYGNTPCAVLVTFANGVIIKGNYIHENVYNAGVLSPPGITGEISVLPFASRVSITDNVIYNPNVGCADGNGYGIAFYNSNYMLISGNRIGDYKTPATMTAALGGQWGAFGLSLGNYYGPRLAADSYFPSDKSTYSLASVQGQSYDLVTGWVSSTTPANTIGAGLPGRGLVVSWNNAPAAGTGLPGLGEVDFYVGVGQGHPGGFNFFQVASINIVSGTYTSSTGAVTLATSAPHGLSAGSVFGLINVTGTAAGAGTDWTLLDGPQKATAGTTGSTLNCTIATGKDITAITGGGVSTAGAEVAGVVNTSVGIGGSLLANDGYGNLRLSGALVHGALQNYGTLTSGGTVTIQPNTSFVLVQNAGSLAALTVVLPNPGAGFAYPVPAVGGNNELEINFQNPVGALTVVAGGTLTVSGAPTTIAAAGTSINFLQHGNAWLRRIMS